MFSISESNTIKIICAPVDMRIGVNSMCGHIRNTGCNPSDGTVYAFVGKSRSLMKLLHWERGGYVIYYKRLEQGRFHPHIFKTGTVGFRLIRWDELVLLIEGISPKAPRRNASK